MLFNCLNRLYTPDHGDIDFAGRSILSLAPHRIAELGIGRTFQNLALFLSMAVLQNVMIGVHSRTRSGFISHALRLPWVGREEHQIHDTAMELLAFLDLAPVAHQPVVGLPFGTLKRVELGRTLAGSPQLLLLDEPAGGLNHQEVAALAALLRRIRDDRRVTMVLVEHHMQLVMQISDRVVVLDFGENRRRDSQHLVQVQRGEERCDTSAINAIGVWCWLSP
jgi:branched-chain amino acid transport system ATP-binding protein